MGRTWEGVDGSSAGFEVLVADANVIFQDASDGLKKGEPSRVLRAVDAGTAVAVMSEQAFRELGWNSAVSARGHHVDHDQLRALIEEEYLPRIPVVVTPTADDESWLPDASEVRDPDDVPHLQVARLICANLVYSHDRDLRIPGFAPRWRRDYETRGQNLTVVTSYREAEGALSMMLTAAAVGVWHLVAKTAAGVGVRPFVLGAVLGVAAAFGTCRAFSSSDRRRRFGEGLEPLAQQVSNAMQGRTAAVRHLAETTYVRSADLDRLEVKVAALLVRKPDQRMDDIGDALGLATKERRQLSKMLRSHPSFELASRWGWSVGRVRGALETCPRHGIGASQVRGPA